jgi:hypothetical protein
MRKKMPFDARCSFDVDIVTLPLVRETADWHCLPDRPEAGVRQAIASGAMNRFCFPREVPLTQPKSVRTAAAQTDRD